MSDSITKNRNKISLEDLEDYTTADKKSAKATYSTFSTLPKQNPMEITQDHSNDATNFKRSTPITSVLQKYKYTINSYNKSFKEGPLFKETIFVIPDIDNKQQQKIEKENNVNYTNYQNFKEKQQFGTPYSKNQRNHKNIEWKSANKIQTAEIIRKLYGSPKIDYNFQYRKKKFFQTFGNNL